MTYSEKDISMKKKLLREIEYAVVSQVEASPYYKKTLALRWGMFGAFISAFVTHKITGLESWNLAFMAILIGGFVSFSFYHLTNYPKTWVEVVDNLLTEYKPIDKEAYNQLQLKTQNNRFLDFNDVFEWIGKERNAIKSISRKAEPQNQVPLNFIKNNTD